MTNPVRPYRAPVKAALIMSGFAVFTMLALQLLRAAEQEFWPVLVDWKAETIAQEGGDLIVTGTQRKARDCVYVPPIRGETPSGEHLLVTSRAPATGQNWRAGGHARVFGPWVIHGANGREVRLYAEHKCHPMWSVFSPLGVVDSPRATGS